MFIMKKIGIFTIQDNDNYGNRLQNYALQKVLIDLFTLKRVNYGLSPNESANFFALLYTPGCNNALRISYNYLNADDIYEVANYFQQANQIPSKVVQEEKKDLFNMDVYKIFNLSLTDLSKMSSNEIKTLNTEIYEAFDISENAINRDYLLQEKLREIKRQNEPLTGNGYVDILLIMSIIVTGVMVVLILGSVIL